MKKRFLMLAVFLVTLRSASAQSISRWECWLDSDCGSRTETAASETTISLSVPVDGLAPGIHFFNFRAVSTSGETGDLYRTLFYLPEEQPADAALTGFEFWTDDDYASRTTRASANAVAALATDVSDLAPGIHFFNFRAMNTSGETGNLYRTLFYLPGETVPDVAGYEYWLDEDEDNSTLADAHGCSVCLAIDVSALSGGKHTFSFRAKSSSGEWGPVHTETFYLEETTGIDELASKVETFDVYNLAGGLVLRQAGISELHHLPSAIYVVNGKKVLLDNR